MGSKDNEAKNFLSKKKIKLYPIVFKWEGEAEKVYLTGSFCDWINFYEMKKNKTKKKFYFTLFLHKGTYQYKFKVDSLWKCNSNYPTCYDENGNMNNYIEVPEKKLEEIASDFSTSSISDYVEEHSEKSLYEFSNIFNKSEDNINLNKEDVNNKNSNINNNLSYHEKLLKKEM